VVLPRFVGESKYGTIEDRKVDLFTGRSADTITLGGGRFCFLRPPFGTRSDTPPAPTEWDDTAVEEEYCENMVTDLEVKFDFCEFFCDDVMVYGHYNTNLPTYITYHNISLLLDHGFCKIWSGRGMRTFWQQTIQALTRDEMNGVIMTKEQENVFLELGDKQAESLLILRRCSTANAWFTISALLEPIEGPRRRYNEEWSTVAPFHHPPAPLPVGLSDWAWDYEAHNGMGPGLRPPPPEP
jgi:hypothetical protein